MILITGAVGNTGRELTGLLAQAGIPFRCMVRRPDAKQELEKLGYDVCLGDFDRPESLAEGLEGITKAYLVCTPDEHLFDRESNFIKAAAAAGVQHLVLLSALLAGPDAATRNLRAHGQVEELLVGSGMDYTILKPHGFFQSLYFMSLPSIMSQGIIALPTGSGRASFIDVRDVAAAAFAVLTSDGHRGKIYDLTGPEAISFQDFADTLGEAMGRSIRFIPIREEDMLATLEAIKLPPWAADHVMGIFDLVRRDSLSFRTESLAQLGIRARNLSQFARDLASGVAGIATSFKAPSNDGADLNSDVTVMDN